MVYSDYVKLRILHYHFKGFTAYTIVKCLLKYDDIKASIVGVSKFLKHYKETGSIARKPGSGRLSKVTSTVKEMVEELMQNHDETTTTQIHSFLLAKGINISLGNQTNRRETDEARRRDYTVPFAPAANRKRLFHLPPHNSSMQNSSRLDVPLLRLLPANQRS